jgi:hypothetical protein
MHAGLQKAKKIYQEGGNVTAYLKELYGAEHNSLEAVEFAYNLQAGTYSRDATGEDAEFMDAYTSDLADILQNYISTGDRVLDAGTGEMTALVGIFNHTFPSKISIFAFDLSLSRILAGRRYVDANLRQEVEKPISFVAELSAIPLMNNSMDVVWASHAFEPNHGREESMLKEVFRVASRKVVLFEPSYENNSANGKLRMEQLGYVRNLPQHIENLGGKLDEIIPIKNIAHPLNPTHAYIIKPPNNISESNKSDAFCCPVSRVPLKTTRKDCYYSSESMLAYPIVSNVPILRIGMGIVSCYPENFEEPI